MKITINKTQDWDLVYKVALATQGKTPIKQFPSSEWKYKMIKSQHSPLRELKFIIEIEDVPNFAITHLVRHVHSQPYVRTMREDLIGIPSSEITRLTPNNFMWSLSGQEILNICKVRLCYKASKETREIIEAIVKELRIIEPELADMCVPSCIAYMGCPELQCCGLVDKFLKETKYLGIDIFDITSRNKIYNTLLH